jgi:4-phytase/acid phosphatase
MLRVLAAVAWLLSLLCPAVPGAAQTLTLDRMVILMRHGVRPPTSSKDLVPLSADAWPHWDVADGQLTPHGAEAVAELGRWERKTLAGRGLLAAEGCARPGDIFVWADAGQQRTVDTADALLSGLYPGCGMKAGHLKGEVADPLFKASETDVGPVDQAMARQAIMAKMGGSFDRPKAEAAALMGQLQGVLRCCAATLCQTAVSRPACGIADLPMSIATIADGRSIDLRGSLGVASTVVQVLLLEYANGLPADQVAWGRASSAADIIGLSAIRKLKYEYQERVPYIARRGASNIANQILLALSHPDGDAANGPPPARLVVFVGNDTQIAEVGAILDAHWTVPGYLDDETPPGGGLGFELLHDNAGARFVRVSFITQKLDQIRSAAALTAQDPPASVPVTVPGCEATAPGTCGLAGFARYLDSRIDRSAVSVPDYRVR